MKIRVDPQKGLVMMQTDRKQAKQEHDVRVRVLVGARLRREEVERYREAAAREGKSLYAWVRDTLRAAVLE